MKNLKKYMALLAAMLLVFSFAACAPAADPTNPPAAQNEKPTEAPVAEPTNAPVVADPTEAVEVTEGTEEVTEPSADYSAYMGQWYSGSVTLNIEAENKWNMSQSGDIFLMGQIIVNEEEGSLHLYDMEGMEAAKILKDGETNLYAELYTEEMYNRIEDYFFTREKPDTDVVVDIEEGSNDEMITGEDSDEIINEG